MKKFLLVSFLLIFIVLISFSVIRTKVRNDLAAPITSQPTLVTPTPFVKINSGSSSKSIFVPYWTVGETQLAVAHYDTVIYFGVAANGSGSLASDPGLTSIEKFVSSVPDNKQKLLTLRMINNDSNFAILKNHTAQNTLINQTITIAKENNFDGIVLDLELSALPFDSLLNQINDFVGQFSKSAKQNNLSFSLLIYGDTFYRLRPFDVKILGKKVDAMMIMAYDFSKANGDPGPGFPLHGQDTYGYDLQKMFGDFSQVVPASKLTVVFGRFGYDWTIDTEGHGIQTATPVTDWQAQKKFLEGCSLKNCIVHHDNQSNETEVTYTAEDGQKHVVWFNDATSIDAKEKFLQQQGITHFGDWAYSYF